MLTEKTLVQSVIAATCVCVSVQCYFVYYKCTYNNNNTEHSLLREKDIDGLLVELRSVAFGSRGSKVSLVVNK